MSAALSLVVVDVPPSGDRRARLRSVPAGTDWRALRRPDRCRCSHCEARWFNVRPQLTEDVVDERPKVFERVVVREQATASALGASGMFGEREPTDASRVVESRALDRFRDLGDVEKLSPGHRRALGLEPAPYERPSRAEAREPERQQPLAKDEQATLAKCGVTVRLTLRQKGAGTVARVLPLLAALQAWPIQPAMLRRHSRWEWISEVWHELVEPPVDVEPVVDPQTRLQRAIWRAEGRLCVGDREIAVPETTLCRRR